MQTLQFKIQINATPEKIWKSLWELENYKKWTSIFCKGSYYKTENFTQGSKIHLLAPNGNGMYSILDKIIENKYLAFRHLGELKNFEEQAIDDAVQKWTNAIESYELILNEEGTELLVNVDTFESYISIMNQIFPFALQELKNISEL